MMRERMSRPTASVPSRNSIEPLGIPERRLQQVVAELLRRPMGRHIGGKDRGQDDEDDHHEAAHGAGVAPEIVPELDQRVRWRTGAAKVDRSGVEASRHGYLACRMRGLISP